MPAVRPPTLWLSVAATAISAVAVAAMASSAGSRRPLTFAGAILLPESHTSAASGTASNTIQLARPGAMRTSARMSAAPPVTTSPAQHQSPQPPAPAAIPAAHTPGARNTKTSSRTPSAPSPASAAGAPSSSPSRPVQEPPTIVPTTPAPGSSPTALAQALFSSLNSARRQAGLAPLSWSPGLQRSAAGHDQAMAAADLLVSRVGDEPALGVRQANQGVIASFSAESLGCVQSPGPAGALAVQQQMLAEQPPADSRRQNLLSTAVNAVGIDILLDPAHGLLWVTEDFAQLS